MKEIRFEETKIIARQILLSFIDVNLAIFPLFDKRRIYRKPLKEYNKFRLNDKEKFKKELYRLQKAKFIKKYYDSKEYHLELTEKGKEQIRKHLVNHIQILEPKTWDKKWRIVVFDIPNDKKKLRDILRLKLNMLGFFELQESVYVFPFDCLDEINFIKRNFYLGPYIQFIIADQIETEKDLIKHFFDKKMLNKEML